MTDLKQISDGIAKAIFDRIEQDRTLILSNVADVIHRELAVRMPYRNEPDPAKVEEFRQSWGELKKSVNAWRPKPMREFGDYPRWFAYEISSKNLREENNG